MHQRFLNPSGFGPFARPLVIALAALAACGTATAQAVFYEHDDFRGRSVAVDDAVGDFERIGFNDRASSVIVENHRWELCEDAGFRGRCVVLAPGRYGSLASMGLNDRVSSVRTLARADQDDPRRDDHRDGQRDGGDGRDGDRRDGPPPAYVQAPPIYAPPPGVWVQPPPAVEYRRRPRERLFEAPVTAVRVVVGNPGQRCWVEREQVNEGRANNAPAAIAGAVLGGIIGHQLGGGFGKDLATAGGVVAGAAIGARVGAGDDAVNVRPVRRCSGTPGPVTPDYWDVSYVWRGVEHRVQMTSPPGRSVTVNRLGDPRY